MKTLFWVLGLFALAVGLALAAHFNTGYALLVLPSQRVELSLNLVVLAVVVAIILGYWLVKAAVATLTLPTRVKQFRLRRRSEKGRKAMLDSLKAFFEGRFDKSEKAAARAMKLGESPALNAIIAARAAHQLREFEKRDNYLMVAETSSVSDLDAKLTTEAELLLNQRRHKEALSAIGRLHHKHTAALLLELKAQQQNKNWEQVLILAEQLEKRDALSETDAERLIRVAHVEILKRKAYDKQALQESWEKLPTRYKRDTEVTLIASEGFLALQDYSMACEIIELSLEEQWDSELVALYDLCVGQDTLKQIEHGEKWLKSHSADAVLLLVLGRLCLRQELWGKAESYLDASLSVEPSYSAHLALADLFEKLGRHDQARRHYDKSMELALRQLKTTSGGRRKLAV